MRYQAAANRAVAPAKITVMALVLGALLQGSPPAVADEVAAPGNPPTSLSRRLDAVLASRPLRGASVGALVVRESDGAVLFAHSPDRPLIPASNQKVLTSIAALEVFGPTHRFETVLSSQAAPDASGTIGDLIVTGGGDPALNSEDWMRLALELRGQGVERVSGDIVLDDSAFDGQRSHPSWGKVGARAYHAPIGALTANYGHFVVTVHPGASVGDAARVEVSPPIPYFTLDNRAATGNGKSSLAVTRKATPTGETVTVSGKVRLGREPEPFYRSVLDPARYAGSVLRWQLEASGVAVDGTLRSGRVPADAVELLRFEGRQLAEIVRLFMKYSNNFVAETLVKSMGLYATGGTGSWSSGVPVMREALKGRGVDVSKLTIVDGSGLSRDNRVTARVLVDALRGAQQSFRFGPEFVSALPIAAHDGTLEKRTGRSAGRVRAKTGLLTSVTSLSGYAITGSDEAAVFAILVNGYKVSGREAMDAVDRFAAELTRAEDLAAAPRVVH